MITYVGPSYWLTCNSVALAVAPKAHAIRRAAVVLILLGLEKKEKMTIRKLAAEGPLWQFRGKAQRTDHMTTSISRPPLIEVGSALTDTLY